jgi:hypothetical protein
MGIRLEMDDRDEPDVPVGSPKGPPAGAEASGPATQVASSQLGLPAPALAAAAVLAACAFVPLTPDGLSFWSLFKLLLHADPVTALVFGLAMGAPFLFGAAVSVGGYASRRSTGWDRAGRTVVHALLALLHAEVVVVAAMLFRTGDLRGLAGALLGFGVVSGVYFAYRSARAAAEAIDQAERLPSLWWMTRWGASVVVVLGAWLKLIGLFGATTGIAVDLATLSALGLATTLQFKRR